MSRNAVAFVSSLYRLQDSASVVDVHSPGCERNCWRRLLSLGVTNGVVRGEATTFRAETGNTPERFEGSRINQPACTVLQMMLHNM